MMKVNWNLSKLVSLHDRPHDTTVTVRRDKISLSLRSWGGFLCPGYFLGGGGARENPACRISYEFWMPPIFVSSVGTVWLPSQEEWCYRYWSDPQTSQAKRNNQVTDRNNYMLQVIQDPGRVLSTYSKFLETKTSIQRWFSHSKKLYASKEVKKVP